MSDLAPHVARYIARVDAHLPTLASDDDRHAFLKAEEAKWIGRYTEFSSRVIAGAHVDPDVQAADYVFTIAELGQRARKYELEAA